MKLKCNNYTILKIKYIKNFCDVCKTESTVYQTYCKIYQTLSKVYQT